MKFRAVDFHLKKNRGKLELQARGRTERGQRFIVGAVELKAEKTSDPELKKELPAAVDSFYPGPDTPPQ